VPSPGTVIQRRRLLTLLAAFGSAAAFAPTARAGGVSAADARHVREVIKAQLAAFAADDARRAFSYATPQLRASIGSPERFMAMVQASYPVVYRPASVTFLASERAQGEVLQGVQMTDESGHLFVALYHLQRQRDRSWRISSCELLQGAGRYT
jgi:hypothetical protein